MFHNYPYTDFHELNLDYIMKLCRESVGLGLKVTDKQLQLVNDLGETISSVTISYADKALKDDNGREISTYLLNIDKDNDYLVLQYGNGSTKTITIPKAEKAVKDEDGNNIKDYVKHLRIDGNNIVVVRGSGEELRITPNYAVNASKATSADQATIADKAILANIATKAEQDVNGNIITMTYAATLETFEDQIRLKAKDGTVLSSITVPYATLSNDANNAIERVEISGNKVRFITYNGTVTDINVPYATKALDDGSGNRITKSYVASVLNNDATGEIIFYAKDGTELAKIVPTVESALNDSMGNKLYDYIKTIVCNDDSNYVTVTHGNGVVNAITINYSNHAWKDTNENIISNTYVAFLNTVKDPETGTWLVAYNGETAELFRLKVTADQAERDGDGNVITETYGAYLAPGEDTVQLKSKHDDLLSEITVPYAEKASKDATGRVIVSGYANNLALDAGKTLYLNAADGTTLSRVYLNNALRPATFIVTVPPTAWDSDGYASVIVTGAAITDRSRQEITPLVVASQSDIDNNDLLIAAELYDAGQSENTIRLWAKNIPTEAISFRLLAYGG